MSERVKKMQEGSLITIAIAEDLEHARDCQRLLRENEIDSSIRLKHESDDSDGVFIVVAEELAEEAQAILAMRNTPEDFFDFGFDDAYMSSDNDHD